MNLTNNRLYEFLPCQLGDMDVLMKEFFRPQVTEDLRRLPKLDNVGVHAGSVWEEDGAYHAELDVPGVTHDGVELTYEQGELQITVERKAPEQRNDLVDERVYGKVKRTLLLPDSIDPDSIEANLEQGVLHVQVAKIPEAQPKRIKVNSK